MVAYIAVRTCFVLGRLTNTNSVEHECSVVGISHTSATDGEMLPAVLSRILASPQYKLVLGSSNWKDLQMYLKAIYGSAVHAESLVSNDLDSRAQVDSTEQPPSKKPRIMGPQKETPPVRVLCSVRFLEQVRSAC